MRAALLEAAIAKPVAVVQRASRRWLLTDTRTGHFVECDEFPAWAAAEPERYEVREIRDDTCLFF
jgi:hypothetical protein